MVKDWNAVVSLFPVMNYLFQYDSFINLNTIRIIISRLFWSKLSIIKPIYLNLKDGKLKKSNHVKTIILNDSKNIERKGTVSCLHIQLLFLVIVILHCL